MSNALSGVGVSFSIGGVAIAEITSLECPTLEAEPIEVTSLDSAGGYREYINGFKDSGEVKIEGNFYPGDAGQAALKTAFENRTLSEFLITFPTAMAATWDFDGTVIEYSVSAEADEAISFECKIKVSGQTNLNLTQSTGLTNLVLSVGTIIPTFATGTYDYVDAVVTGTTTLNITPTGAGVITINGVTATSGAPSAFALGAAGTITTATIVIKETNKIAKTYVVKIARA